MTELAVYVIQIQGRCTFSALGLTETFDDLVLPLWTGKITANNSDRLVISIAYATLQAMQSLCTSDPVDTAARRKLTFCHPLILCASIQFRPGSRSFCTNWER